MELMDWIWIIIIFAFSFIATFFITWFLSKFFLKKGIYGHDVHKKDRPKVAEMGGVGLVIVFLIVTFCCIFIFQDYWEFFTVSTIVIVLVAAIGIWDDLKTLGATIKPFLLLIPSIPIILWQLIANPTLDSTIGPLLFNPRPYLPLIGSITLTIIYWILVPFAITVLSNATNMLDVMNGSTPLTMIFVTGAAFISTVVLKLQDKADIDTFPGMILSILLLGCLFAFFIFNRYPARIFCGDTGSLTIGAMIALVAIFGRIEIIIIVAMMPQIMNSFQIIYSIKGLRERREIKERPTIVHENETISANPHEKAPLTLTRWIVAKQPLYENEAVLAMGLTSVVASCLALITLALIYVGIP